MKSRRHFQDNKIVGGLVNCAIIYQDYCAQSAKDLARLCWGHSLLLVAADKLQHSRKWHAKKIKNLPNVCPKTSQLLQLITLCLLVSSADNFCKKFGPRPGPTKCRAESRSKLTVWRFDGIPEILFLKSWFWKKSADDKKASKEMVNGNYQLISNLDNYRNILIIFGDGC